MVQFEWGPFNIKMKLKFWILVVNQVELLSIPEQSRTADSFLFLQQYQSTTKLASLWTEDTLLQVATCLTCLLGPGFDDIPWGTESQAGHSKTPQPSTKGLDDVDGGPWW